MRSCASTAGKVVTTLVVTNGGKSRLLIDVSTPDRHVRTLPIVDRMDRRLVRRTVAFLVAFVSANSAIAGGAVAIAPSSVSGLEPIRTVTIVPPYGYYDPPIRVRLSATERRIISRLGREALTWDAPDADIGRPVIWHVEPAVASSPTLALARRVLATARSLLAWDGSTVPAPVDIVVGRTQDYLEGAVAKLGCSPQRTLGEATFLMGSTICNGSVIVINLTGYLFIRRRDQELTAYLERLREPPISATWYLIVDRNMRSLAHEWVHVARFSPLSLRIARNEPVWMREGIAENLSGMAAVRATGGRLSYLEHHVISVRKFSRWTSTCTRPLRAYRVKQAGDGYCEYFAGAAASSLLLADHGGLTRLHEYYRAADAVGDWITAFASVYGMTLDEFETKADRYIAQIRTLTGA